MYPLTQENNRTNYFQCITKKDKYNFAENLDITTNNTDTLFSYSTTVFVSPVNGYAVVVLTDSIDDESAYEYYSLSGTIEIKANTYFNVLSLSENSTIKLESNVKARPKLVKASQKLSVRTLKPNIKVDEIYNASYELLNPSYKYKSSTGDYYLMVIVDKGQLTQINYDEKIYIKQNEFYIVPRNTHFTHKIDTSTSVSCAYIYFSGRGFDTYLTNKKSSIPQSQVTTLRKLFQSSNDYNADYFLTFIYNAIIPPIENDEKTQDKTSMRDNYENELFDQINAFLDENIETHHEVQDLVDEFSLSRSTLQNLFNDVVGLSPKTYINNLRLERSKKYIQESSLTLTQIAEKLGYGSIQYFSRVFKNEFGISPSEYAKKIH